MVAPKPAKASRLASEMAGFLDGMYLILYTHGDPPAELLFGVGALSSGQRRDALVQRLRGLARLFGDRVLAFDTDAARHYGELAVKARAAGKGFPTPDGYIAAIANAHGFTVATRYVAPFQAAGLTVINPRETPQWTSSKRA